VLLFWTRLEKRLPVHASAKIVAAKTPAIGAMAWRGGNRQIMRRLPNTPSNETVSGHEILCC
jgi:hypothetical protein